MARQEIKGVSINSDERDQLNANFTELYAPLTVAGVTASAAELNILDGVTAIAAEINTLDGVPTHFTTATVPASGTCAATFTLANVSEAIESGTILSGLGYISTSINTLGTAITSVATLSKGTINTLVTGSIFFWVADGSGELNMTLTGAAGSYYVSLLMPTGEAWRSEACVINA